MRKDLERKLLRTYEDLFSYEVLENGFSCDDGWHDLIESACEAISGYHANQKAQIRVAKEFATKQSIFDKIFGKKTSEPKFSSVIINEVGQEYGELRIGITGGDPFIEGILYAITNHSLSVCERCGDPGENQPSNSGHIITRCPRHSPEGPQPPKKKGAISLDFDGVINSYKSGFVAVDQLPDPPTEGAFDFIEDAIYSGYKVYIFSTRNGFLGGKEAIKSWLIKHDMSKEILDKLEFPDKKPIAKVYIDDRAWEFRGRWPELEEIDKFQTWHKGKSSSQK
jgi:hypothetical protein